MSTHTLNSQNSNHTGTPILADQPKLLDDALAVVKLHAFHMKKSIDSNQLYDALKHASTMLQELKTSSLLPKYYYQLCMVFLLITLVDMALFDELRYLTNYLLDVHSNGTHKLSDLYALIQYATNIIPRLYLMITVGSVFMKVSKDHYSKKQLDLKGKGLADDIKDSEIPQLKELMKDMLEMTRGVQHPTRGLFLRYYLSGQTRDYLPDCEDRLQHQGHSRDREKREQERRDLRLLVGSNLVRLSQLEETTLEMYKQTILPSILDEIAFPDEFHLHCLDIYLSSVAQLQPSVNVKQIVISLINRFAGYAARAREEASSAQSATPNETPISGIPDDVKLFDIFWSQITDLIQARPEFTIEDVIALLASLNDLALNCYPETLEYCDRVLGMAKAKLAALHTPNQYFFIFDLSESIQLGSTKSLLLQLLLSPINAYSKNLLTFLKFPSSSCSAPHGLTQKSSTLGGNYTDLLYLQPYTIRREVAHTFAKNALKAAADVKFKISSVEGVNFFLGEVCSIMVRDQVDGNLFGSKASHSSAENAYKDEVDVPLEWEDALDEQTLVAKLVHLFKAGGDNPKDQYLENRDSLDEILKGIHETISLLCRAREYFAEDENYAPLFQDEQSLNQGTVKLGRGVQSPYEMSLNFYLLAAQVANLTDQEEMCYESFVEAFIVYEESISESKAQFNAISQIIATLYKTTVFGYENYETLITKCAVHCSRLLKRADQCRGVMLASHLFWADNTKERHESKPAYRDGKRVLECLQKSLKIADSVMDHTISVGLFVEILECYIWFFEKKNESITPTFINSMIELIRNNLVNPVMNPSAYPISLGGPLGAPPKRSSNNNAKKLSESTVNHFINILQYISLKKEEDRQSYTSPVVGMELGFQEMDKIGRWGDVIVPDFDRPSSTTPL
ncbi:Vacuolar protein sorting-associated protein 35 [Globomyces sp. JEL0801]|nr:Vacuolar protein sorting-associated protein 35 [Globomyces sp. JEL0801]